MQAASRPPFTAKLTSFHTAAQENNSFTVYVVTVRKGNAQWQVFRRYKEWEDLRARLCHLFGNAPAMPGKILFGRMRPEVIEARVLGLDQFLQMLLRSDLYATSEDVMRFLEREKNLPPLGLDLMADALEAPDAAAAEPSAEGTRQAQLKRLVEAAAQAFIPVDHDPPALERSYLAERAANYASVVRPAVGPPVGSSLSLRPPSRQQPSGPTLEAVLQRCLAAADASQADADEVALARATAAAAAKALSDVSVRGKHEVLVTAAG